jgi:hypothetical protein
MSDSIEPTKAQNKVACKDFKSISEFAELFKAASQGYGTENQYEKCRFAEAFSQLVLDENKPLSDQLKKIVLKVTRNIELKTPYDDAKSETDSVVIRHKEASKAARLVNQHMIWERLGDVQEEIEYL